jgi:hypothetical protein
VSVNTSAPLSRNVKPRSDCGGEQQADGDDERRREIATMKKHH